MMVEEATQWNLLILKSSLWLSFLSFFRDRDLRWSSVQQHKGGGTGVRQTTVDQGPKTLRRACCWILLWTSECLWEHALLMWVLSSYVAYWPVALADYSLHTGRQCQKAPMLLGNVLKCEYFGPSPWHLTEPWLVTGSPSTPSAELSRAPTSSKWAV